MKPVTLVSTLIILLSLLSISGPAQAPLGPNRAQWNITENEVFAVQTVLQRQGYYDYRPSGVLDDGTRSALRSYQADNGLRVTGRIDRPTYDRLGLPYPAMVKVRDKQRLNGTLPSIGYGIKDTMVEMGRTVGGVASKVKGGTMTGYRKTREVGGDTVSETKGMAHDMHSGTSKGVDSVKTVGRETYRVGNGMVNQNDDEIKADIHRILNLSKETEHWDFEVKNGMVTIKIPPEHNADIGSIVSGIRRVSGVKSVFVVAE